MKIKTLSILFISCILLTSCNNADSVETIATVESIESVETVTEIEEPTTIEKIESTVEVEETETVTEEIETESIQFVGTEVSKFAGTTSKHGYKYPADYVENSGNSVADTERMFDEGFFSEEEYQEMIEFARELDSGSIEQKIQDEINSFNNNSGGTTGGGSSNPPGTPGYDPATYIPEGNTYHPDGRICY